MRYVTMTLAIALLLAIGIFAIQNLPRVDVSFLFWSFSMPKTVLILVTYFLGMVTGWGLVELVKMVVRDRP